jgi:hypothetical protein
MPYPLGSAIAASCIADYCEGGIIGGGTGGGGPAGMGILRSGGPEDAGGLIIGSLSCCGAAGGAKLGACESKDNA